MCVLFFALAVVVAVSAAAVTDLGTAEANGPGGASVTFAASAIDLVDGHPSLSYSAASGSVFRIGTTAVTVTATDASGNSSTSSFNVTVADTTAPVLTVPANQTAEATSAAGAPVTFAASATDAVGATVAYSKAPGSVFPVGTTTVTVTATDAAGNSTTGSFTVTVKDTTAPIITAPAAITAEATSAAGATVTFAATATDAVGATLSYSKAPGSVFPIGTTTVTVSATDAAGNNAVAKTFTVTVRDTTGPVFTALTTSAPSLWPPNHKLVAITVSATAADVVSGTTVKILSVTSNEPDNGLGDGDTPNDIAITGVMTLNLRAERSGTGTGRTYTITVQATDAAGNKSTKTVAVVVPLNQGK